MYTSSKNIKKSYLFFLIFINKIKSEIKTHCSNFNKKNVTYNDINSNNLVIHKDNKISKSNKNIEINKNNEFKENNKNIEINDIKNNNDENNLNINTKTDQNENKIDENIINENKKLCIDDFRSDDFIINDKKKIEIKNISNITDINEFKKYINSFLINSTFNINDSDLEKFLKHYKSNEELLNPNLYYIIFEFFKQEVDNDKLLQLIEHKLDYNNQIILNYNKTVDYKNNTIYFVDNDNISRYFKKYNDYNIVDKNVSKDIEIICKDIKRTVEFTFDNKILEESPIEDNFINSLTKVLVNLELNKTDNKEFYVQGMNLLARFFLFLTKEENNNKDIIFNPLKSYKLNYLFFNYKFNETFLKELLNKTSFTILDCYNSFDNITKASDVIKQKITKNLNLSKKEIKLIEQNIICFTTMFPFDITLGICNYNILKNLFLLLFILDRYNVIFDIFSLYLLEILKNENNEDINKKKYNFNKFEEIFNNDN